MQKLRWDPNLAASAKKYSQKCDFNHSKKQGWTIKNIGNNYAENISFDTFYAPTKTVKRSRNLARQHKNMSKFIRKTIRGWGDEYKNREGSSRESDCKKGFCLHYTNMVFAETERVGCGISTCQNLKSATWGNKNFEYMFMVCQYFKPAVYKDPVYDFTSKSEKIGASCRKYGRKLDPKSGLCVSQNRRGKPTSRRLKKRP